MIIFKEQPKEKKSWCLDLKENELYPLAGVDVDAVDSKTGERIVTLITFQPDGKVLLLKRAKHYLEKKGYVPEEHNNTFDQNGVLIVEGENG